MKVQVELDELLELQARVTELEEEVKFLKSETYTWFSGKQTTITDIKGDESKFPDHTMD